MKVSLNLIRHFQQIYEWSPDPAPNGAAELIQRIGAQLGAVEESIDIGSKYQGVLIVKVVSCDDHPNADRLHVCMIDDGGAATGVDRNEAGLVQVVCGAPNVRAGMTVAWLPPGSTVPSSYGVEPFVLEARELRGVVSNGMLASPKELGIGDSHDGILEIEEEIAPGTRFADHYYLDGDVVIDIENKMFTHRPDCFGVIGVAREIAGIQHQPFVSPAWYRADAEVTVGSNDLKVEVRNEIPELVPRFVVVPMSGIAVASSPVWLQVALVRLGVRPINNIVDLTNYYMLLTGQPLHAYDYDKVVAQDDGAAHATIVVRAPQPDERLTLLNGKTIEPRDQAIMIASATKAIGLGGVMGGGDTEVDDSTTNIILECATFDMYSIRRTSMAHGLFSDAVTRFNKGQSPLQNMAILSQIVKDISELTGAVVAGQVVDDNHLLDEVMQRSSLHAPVKVSAQFINERLGLSLSASEMITLLTNVEFGVSVEESGSSDDTESVLTVQAPFWRTDIEIPEDIVEEVGRLYGFDQLPLVLPGRDLTPATRNQMLDTKQFVRDTLSAAGANEVLGYSFVHGNLLSRTGQDSAQAFQLSNALSPDLQYYRISLMPSLLEKIHPNIKAGYDRFALYEMGKSHTLLHQNDDPEGLPQEFDILSFVYAADVKAAPVGAAYYQARNYLVELMDRFGATLEFKPMDEASDIPITRPYAPGRSAYVSIKQSGAFLGIIGEFTPAVRKGLKLPQYAAGFEIDVRELNKLPRTGTSYTTLPRFPKVTQDISLRVKQEVSYRALHGTLTEALAAAAGETLTTIVPLDIYVRDDNQEFKQIAFRVSVSSYDKTMTDSEVAGLLDSLAAAAHETCGAERL